jgi:surface protein
MPFELRAGVIFKYGLLAFWDVSRVTDMSGVFNFDRAEPAGLPDLRLWDVSAVTNMENMFAGTSRVFEESRESEYWGHTWASGWSLGKYDRPMSFYRNRGVDLNIGNWNTSRVTNMAGMFKDSHFKGDIGKWDTSKVTTMARMFQGATAFNGDIGKWDTSKVTDMKSMFNVWWNDEEGAGSYCEWDGCVPAFNQDIGNWNTAQVTDMRWMFAGQAFFNKPSRSARGTRPRSPACKGCFFPLVIPAGN